MTERLWRSASHSMSVQSYPVITHRQLHLNFDRFWYQCWFSPQSRLERKSNGSEKKRIFCHFKAKKVQICLICIKFKQLLDQSERFQLCNVSTCGASCWFFLNKSKKRRQILVLNPFLNFRLIVELKFEEPPVLCLTGRAAPCWRGLQRWFDVVLDTAQREEETKERW